MTDELVLNFSPPSASPSSAPTRSTSSGRRKGGRWTDRAKERKRSQIEARKASRGTGTREGGGLGQGVKRSREDEGADDAAGAKRERTAGGGGGAHVSQGGKRRLDMAVGPSGKKQYISSLFTAEGLPTAADSSTSSSAPILPSKPSNAPLASVTSTATDAAEDGGEAEEGPDPAPELSKLGLMRELVTGLAGKLGITGPTACQAGAIPRLVPPSSAFASTGKGKGRASGADFAHDAILRAQTGSGKTLTFLLPMLQDLLTLPPSSLSTPPPSSAKTGPDRSIGTLALILAPTRELASQIHTVLSSLLSSLPSSSPNPNKPFTISPRALTAGLLVGGANRTHEKRRLRKGCPIVVATPGRLLDHLKTTEAFRLAGEAPKPKDAAPKGRPGNPNTVALGTRGGGGGGEGKVGLRWLIVDECDRLMDLGFEEQMKGILEELARRSASTNGATGSLRRRTILCSATASEGVDRLAGMAISDADEGGKGMVVVGAREDVRVKEPERRDLTQGAKRGAEAVEDEDRAEDDDDEREEEQDASVAAETAALALPSGFTPPSQLQHNYIVVPPKLRFVTLVALLRKLLVKASSANGGRGMKVLVFMSCTDAVDFWWKALGKMKMGTSSTDDADDEEEEEEEDEKAESARLVSLHPLLPSTPIYRLHGSLPLQTRLSSLSAFSSPYTIEEGKRKGSQTDAGVLLCTSVAARGLDVKNVGCVVQVDAPTEGGVTEYVHRVGRTARAGAQGTAYSLILPSESAYTSFLEDGINSSSASAKGKKVRMREVGVEQVLREGYGGEGREYETRATDVQMGFERWVNASEETASLARKAFQAHIRAYATHPSSEKHIFNTKALHLGHLAKSFGMREAPGSHTGSSSKKGGSNKKARVSAGGARTRDDEGGFEVGPRKRKAMDAEQRMKKLMRGPQALGASEFHIAGNDMLEGVVRRK